MPKVVRFLDYRQDRRSSFVHFNRSELHLLLGLYSRKVESGEWRDYAIDQGAGQATFSIFRQTCSPPLFTITKKPGGKNGQRAAYVVTRGQQSLRRATSMQDALSVFEISPGLAPGA
ncbi:DUF2794 domain-containing protein [Telmatospirillum sp. J64-1]|uniref:DUF2794 domain-containing protein n=1 Tax=Telmatospirillum sp. J64-1 TaxID=2502183 RepID=UPI00115E9560|nr:DUF2794 domain-containing protein [Telmatospirillum sp. J64-1]